MEKNEQLPRAEALEAAFQKIWFELFSSPVHLDSALSKQSSRWKSILAQILPSILLKPVSLAEGVGVGVAEGEPWSLPAEKLAKWRAAPLMAARLYDLMTRGGQGASATPADFPPRFWNAWKEAWGEETALQLVKELSSEAPLSLRATRSEGADKILAELSQGGKLGVKAERSNISPVGIRLSGYTRVLHTAAYERGAFEIQDEGSQVMALFALWPELFATILQEKPGPVGSFKAGIPALPEKPEPITVVDACAGAGGKSLALADALNGRGRVFAYDTSERKLQALRRRASHAGLRNIKSVTVTEGKEEELVAKFRNQADVVLVDAPCSGWGVLRRNPDIKWRQDVATLERMPEIQYRVLQQYSGLVAPGGRLVFGVCTFRLEETQRVVERFLENHSDFEKRQGGYLGPGPSDGFFMQAFQRKA